jgi:hypothetical protein
VAVTFVFTNALFAESAFVTNIIDNQGNVGRSCSIAVDSNQNPVIAYHSETDYCIKFATIEDTNYAIEIIPDTEYSKGCLSLAVDSCGEFGIAYPGRSNLMFSFKTSWFDWCAVAVDEGFGFYFATALAFSKNDVPHIAYCSRAQLKHATYDVQTNSWASQVVYLGYADLPSIAVDSSDKIIITFESEASVIHTAINAGLGWSFLPSFEGIRPSMALDAAEQPAVAYIHEDKLCYATYTPIGWIHTIVDDGSEGPISDNAVPSLAFDNNGNPAIAYLRDGRLTYAANHAGWLINSVDESDADIQHVDLVFDSNNMPFIAFYDAGSNWDGTSLKLAGIGLTPTCVADLNSDGCVDFLDYAIFANAWCTFGSYNPADLDGNKSVDSNDLMIFCSYWLWP